MKKIKSLAALILALTLVFTFVSCSGNDKSTTTAPVESTTPTSSTQGNSEQVRIAAQSGPTGMGMVDLMENSKYKVTISTDPTEIVSLISTGAVDIASCPLNIAANLYKKTGGKIKMLGVNTLGVLYVVTNGVQINKLSDLKDKTVYLTGQGATPEFIVSDILSKNNLKDSVKLEFLSEHSELATKLASGDVQIAVLPEPFVTVATSANASVKVALSLTDEWNAVNPDTELAMGCVIARSEFIEKNPDKVKEFIEDNKKSVEFVNTNPLEAAAKISANKIVSDTIFAVDENQSANKVNAAKLEKAKNVISRCNIVFIDGEEMQKIANANFEVYFKADATSVGGALPTNDLYYAAS